MTEHELFARARLDGYSVDVSKEAVRLWRLWGSTMTYATIKKWMELASTIPAIPFPVQHFNCRNTWLKISP